jgi:tetratricopeptide (TPR) repeat protein
MPEDLTHTAGPSRDSVVQTSTPPVSPPGYELLDEIGRGGMGVVYRARDTALARDVAVKLLSDRYPADSAAAQRFLSEARITGQLQHPGIPAVHQVGTLADGRPFLAMKLIKGSTLEALLKQRPDPAAERGRLLAVFEAVCQAVGYAHAHRVIHRDVKPANVMVGAFGEVQVMDWGLAKILGEETQATTAALAAGETQAWTQVSPTPEAGSHTQAGSVVGTPAFIPPEQALGEIDKVNERADVFGLGALLAVILTGKPPYVGESFESVRVQAARGKLDNCFARLDACGAEPELIALCKRCLVFEPMERPHDAGAVAQAVAGLRAAAEERAQTAERDQAAAAARSAERHKRRRLWLGAAASLALAALGGLSAVLAVQARARYDLEAKNAELSAEQAKVEARNRELADEKTKVEQRFELAQKAIALFHTGVSEDMLLKNAEFKDLRTKLLKEAKGFYEDLEKLLAVQTDAKSRKALAAAYFQLGELIDKIDDKKEALAVHRKALALRRELAAVEGADVETRLDVARSLLAVGLLLEDIGNPAEALSAFQEQRDLAAALEAESPTEAVRVQLGFAHNGIGFVLEDEGKLAEALDSYRKALAIYQKLPEAAQYLVAGQGPTFGAQLQAGTYMSIGALLSRTGKPEDRLESYRKALDILEELAKAHPANTSVQSYLGRSYGDSAIAWIDTGKPVEAVMDLRKAVAAQQKIVDVNSAVSESQVRLAYGHNNMAFVLARTGKLAEALKEFQEGLAIIQKLAAAHPANTNYQNDVAWGINHIGRMHARQKRFTEAFAGFERGLPILQKLVAANPTVPGFTIVLGCGHAFRGSAHLHAGHPAEAAADLRRAVALLDKGKDKDAHFERSRALALLTGLAAEPKSSVTKDEAKAFADQAVLALREAIRGGWNWPGELKESDFDALRGRDDFKKLVAELEAKAGPKVKPKD